MLHWMPKDPAAASVLGSAGCCQCNHGLLSGCQEKGVPACPLNAAAVALQVWGLSVGCTCADRLWPLRGLIPTLSEVV